jgi:hypothetical protein
MPLEKKMSKPMGRSSSVRNPPTQRDLSAPAILTGDAEPYDTALPPMCSKELVVTTRRHQGGHPRLPYPQNLTSIQGGIGNHRRTGSTLKTVMKKIFTRNRRSRTDDLEDPIADFKFNDSTFPASHRLKSPDTSNSGSSRQGALVQQPTETLTTLDVVLKQLDTEPRQRRATLPSLIFSDDESRQALEAVVHPERKSSNLKLSPHACSDPEEIRRRRMRSANRRSRSAGALRVLAQEHHRMSPIQWKRRRSVESEFLASTTCGIGSDSDSSRPPTRSTVATASTFKPSADASAFEEEPENEPMPPPSLPPNVGELISSMQTDDNASLEQRMTTLEVKLIDLEFAIARMQSGRIDTPAADAPKRRGSEPSRHKRQKSSAKSSAKSPGHSPPSTRDDSSTTQHISSTDRPLSASTIRPSPSDIHRARALQAPSMVSLNSDSGAISVQQYSALVMLLRREQTARRNLEQQVSGLREDIERLTQMARDSIGVGTMYPIRSVESEEYMRIRPDDSPSSSPRQTSDKLSSQSRHKSDSESSYSRDHTEAKPRDDRFRPWQATRRVEVANMI